METEEIKTARKAQKKGEHKGGKRDIVTAVGRRKTSVARIALSPGEGKILINGKPYQEYVSNRHALVSLIEKSLNTSQSNNSFDINIRVNGGGVSSQADAIRLGIARAIVKTNPEKKIALSKGGCLARDPRIKERKKYGRKKARKRFQFTKR